MDLRVPTFINEKEKNKHRCYVNVYLDVANLIENTELERLTHAFPIMVMVRKANEHIYGYLG